MKFISENKISEELINSFDEEMNLENLEFARMHCEDNYNIPFDRLKNRPLLRPLAIKSLELTPNYIHLFEK